MSTPQKKEARTEVLYAHVKKTNKAWLKANYKKLGYSTLSEFLDVLLDNVRKGKK